MTAKLKTNMCPGAGSVVRISSADAQFRTMTCPDCNRASLGAINVRWEDGSDVATVPQHRAKVTTASDVRLEGTQCGSTMDQQAALEAYWDRYGDGGMRSTYGGMR